VVGGLTPLKVLASQGVEVEAFAAQSAEPACEDLIDRRVGAELEHRGPMEGATVEGEGPYVVRNGFVEPLSRQATSYVASCTPSSSSTSTRSTSTEATLSPRQTIGMPKRVGL
jgi:hypothetical protein